MKRERCIHTDSYSLTQVDLDIGLFVTEFIAESYLLLSTYYKKNQKQQINTLIKNI